MRRPLLAAIAAIFIALAALLAAPAAQAAPLPVTSSAEVTQLKPTPSPYVCLSRSSATYAYLIANHTDGKRFVNRDKCSVKTPKLLTFEVSKGYTCRDQLGYYYYSGYRYSAAFYSGSVIACWIPR